MLLRRVKRSFSSYSYQDLEQDIVSSDIKTVIVGFSDLYGRLLGKRYDAKSFLKNVGTKGASHVCTYLLTSDMELTPLNGFKLSNPQTGYGDFALVPDYSSLRKAAWQKETALVICDLLDDKTHSLIPMAPRSILKRVIENSKHSFGTVTKAASELEYYLFQTSFEDGKNLNYNPKDLKRVGFYNEDYVLLQGKRSENFHSKVREYLNQSGLIVECCKGETGIGQHELNVEYSEALKMADNHMVMKQCMKEVCIEDNKAITFMAKPFTDDAGSSCHIHLSLHDATTGKNLFQGNESCGNIIDGVSSYFKYFLGGWMTHTSEVFPLYAPTVNSYKRLVRGSWAPTTATWGTDNRTTSFRVLGKGKSLRIECRLPGADANPYLAFAAAIASGMDGIKNKIEPPPPTIGDGDSVSGLVPLPKTLGEAAKRLANSSLAKEAFGEETREHLAHFYECEQRAYDQQVSDWERNRYFERI